MKVKQRGFLLILAAFLVFSLAGVSFGQDDIFVKGGVGTVSKQKWVPGEIIVKFKAGVSQDVIGQANQTHGCSVLSVNKRGKFHRLGISKNRTVEEMVSIYDKNPNVEYAEPNFIASALYAPNDPLFYPYQWNLHDSSGGITGGINMESAWDLDTTLPLHGGDPRVVVAVLDTGVAYLAPDLANAAFVQGYDFINNDNDPSDDNSHGTHVTGTIAQSTNNYYLDNDGNEIYIGTAGIAFNTAIMPVKVLDSTGSGSYENIVDGIYFAADNGADVINMSLGGPSASPTLESALAYAHDVKGVTIVCAAGNEFEEGNPTVYPAAYDDYCIAVGATRYDETRSWYSNTGPYVDIAAPGGHIVVDPNTGEPLLDQNGDGEVDGILQQTFNPNTKDTNDFGYWWFQGTSMATPHVAGVAALLIANGICQENLRLAIELTAKDLGAPGRDDEYGWGLLDAPAALNYVLPDVVHDVAVTDISVPSPTLDGNILVNVNVANWGTFEESFMVTLYVDGDPVGDSQSVSSLAACAKANLTFDWSGATIGTHTLRAVADLTSDEIDTNNSIETTVMVQDSNAQEGPDVEVVSLDAPLEVTKGGSNIVNVTAVIANTLDLFSPLVTAYVTVSLYDVTDGRQIDVSLGPDYPLQPFWQGLTMLGVEWPWDITNASIGTHELRVDVITASVDPVPENNFMTAYTDVLGSGVDEDGDGVPDGSDQCPGTPAGETVDADGCSDTQLDDDGDGVNNALDQCPGFDDRLDADGDTIPDDCDVCPNDPDNDADDDGVCGDLDICEGGDDNVDADSDGIPDFCDNCPGTANNDQADADGDGVGDVCDSNNDPLEAVFSVSPTKGDAPLTVLFTDQSTGDITNWDWTVERWHDKRSIWINVADLTGQGPHYVVLENKGLHKTTLTVTGPGGSHSLWVEIIVNKAPKGGGNGDKPNNGKKPPK